MKWAWTTFLIGVYQPLAWLLFEAQYVFYELDPRGYHLTSLLLHVADAVVLYVLTVTLLVRCQTEFRLASSWPRALSAGLATALFATHPLRVEAVAWVSCQPYLPCILFAMLSVLVYLGAFPANSTPRWGLLAGSFFFFLAALLFKAVAVNLPVVLLILDVYPLRRLPDATGRWFGPSARRVLWEKAPFVVLSLVFMGVAIRAREQSPFLVESYEVSEGIVQACYAVWFYILKTLWPRDLIAFYPLPHGLNWLAFPYGLGILATLGVSVGLFLVRRRWPGLLAAWLIYLVILIPNSGIIRNNSFVIAGDRYSYLAMLGFVPVAAFGFRELWRLSSRISPVVAVGIMAIGLGTLLVVIPTTRNQCRTWLSSGTLWAHVLTHGGNASFLPHNNFGIVLCAQGKYKAAEAHFSEALRLNPDCAEAHNNLALLLLRQRTYGEAETHFAEAIRINPGDAGAHRDLGNLLYTQGRYQEAEAHLTEALRLNPNFADAHINVAMILFRRGRYAEAEAHFTEALRLNPGSTDVHNNLGTVLSRQKRYAEAEAHFTEALRLDPGFVAAHFNLGLVRAEQGKDEAAVAHYTEAIRRHPGYVGAHHNLGNVLCRFGKYEPAAAHYSEAIRLDPGYAEAYNASAMLMAACPEAKFRNGKKAVQFATRGCELTKWKEPRFFNTLAAAQAEAGDFDAAVSSQKRAIEFLADERQKADYRSRLVLYQAKKPYRHGSPQNAPTEALP